MNTRPSPQWHNSQVREVGPLRRAEAIEGETALFAAEAGFAHAHGGPITQAFIELLPAGWGERVLIDSSLVWLTPGIAHAVEVAGAAFGVRGQPRFHHEPFPGATSAVCLAANANTRVVYRMCVLGVDSTPEVAVGRLDFAQIEQAEGFWGADLQTRATEVEHRVGTGSLIPKAIPLGVVVEFGWGTFVRSRPAAASGFQLILRATAFDTRPAVNGRRNLAML